MAQLASTTVFGELLVTAKSLLQGNVGIGTTSPSWKLHVSHSSGGDATYSGGILIENTSTTAGEPNIGFKNAGMGSNFWFVGPNQDTDMNFAYGTTHSDANTKMTIASDGNVGIGTTAPSEKLEVVGNIRLVGAGGTGDGSLEIWRGTNASWKILNTSGKLKFQSNFTSSVGNYYDAMILDYNTGNLWFKGSLTGGTVPWERISGAPSTFNPATHTHSNITITAGNGLSGGGTLASNRTITLGTPGTITNSTSNEVTSTSHTHALTLPTTATRWPSWSEVTDKPSTFAPATHTHTADQISGSYLQLSGRSTSWGSTDGTSTGAVNAIMGTSSGATWLISGTSNGTFRGGIQLLDSGGTMRLYTNTSYLTISGSTVAGSLAGNASTATKLETARTINGTSFDGSANITTVRWGTSRTLTIGSTGKSVNGSSNVSWTLAEIGAAPASHTHTASQVGLGNVQNYGIATQAQAQAGTANNVYMTPLRVKEAISSLPPSSHTHAWSEVTGKPSTFPPSSHTHQATLTATLNTTGWMGIEAPFAQIQQVSGILATDVPIVDVVLSGDWGVDEARLEAWGYIYRITTSNNSITVYAREKPEVALPLQLKVVR